MLHGLLKASTLNASPENALEVGSYFNTEYNRKREGNKQCGNGICFHCTIPPYSVMSRRAPYSPICPSQLPGVQ